MELASLASHNAFPCGPESSCRRGDGCDRHPHLSAYYRGRRNAESLHATVDGEGIEGGEPELADAGLALQLQPPNSQLEADRHPINGMYPATAPQVVESRARTPTLPDDESTSELEPADAEPRLQPQSPSGAASGRGVDPQQRSGSRGLSQDRDHRDGNAQASGPEQRHPLAPDDGQDEESSVVPTQAQESRTGMPSLSGDESGNKPELANTEPSMQPSASQQRVNLRRDVGHRRRRRRCGANDEEDYSPIGGSDSKQGKDDDAARPPRGKRRRVNTPAPAARETAPGRRARLRCTNSPSLRARRPPPAGNPERRQSQRSISEPQPSTLRAAFASFEEWPLKAVVKRVLVDGVATFQVEFTWNPCTNHGRNDHTPETQRRKLPSRTFSTGRAFPLRVASTAVEVQDGEYFQVEDILEWREGEEEREYLVKWKGYGHKHNTWEPATHFKTCPEVLEEFHQTAGLSTAPSM